MSRPPSNKTGLLALTSGLENTASAGFGVQEGFGQVQAGVRNINLAQQQQKN
jgi:hypothetical protein